MHHTKKTSTRQRSQPLLITPAQIFITCLLLALSSTAQAACRVKNYPGLQHVNFTGAEGFTIPRDTPDGTVLYTSEQQSIIYTEFLCTTESPRGYMVDPSRGIQPQAGDEFPIGIIGLAARIKNSPPPSYITVASPTEPYTWSLLGFFQLEIIKRGHLSALSTIKPGRLGKYVFGEAVPLTFNLTKPIEIIAASCETPNISVEMGNYSVSELGFSMADTTKPVNFNIPLNNCSPDITKISYKLIPSTPEADWKNGVFRLTPNSTSADVALQITNPDNTPVPLNTFQRFNEYTPTGGNFQIPLTARYYRMGKQPIKAGTANGELTVIMEYL